MHALTAPQFDDPPGQNSVNRRTTPSFRARTGAGVACAVRWTCEEERLRRKAGSVQGPFVGWIVHPDGGKGT